MNGQILPLIAKDESTKVSKQGWPSMVMPCLDQSCRMINGRALHTMCHSDKNNNLMNWHTHKKKGTIPCDNKIYKIYFSSTHYSSLLVCPLCLSSTRSQDSNGCTDGSLPKTACGPWHQRHHSHFGRPKPHGNGFGRTFRVSGLWDFLGLNIEKIPSGYLT